jgi:hypothetical protein
MTVAIPMEGSLIRYLGVAAFVSFGLRLILRPLFIVVPHTFNMLGRKAAGGPLEDWENSSAMWTLVMAEWSSTLASLTAILGGIVACALWLGFQKHSPSDWWIMFFGTSVIVAGVPLATGASIYWVAVGLVQSAIGSWLVLLALRKTKSDSEHEESAFTR